MRCFISIDIPPSILETVSSHQLFRDRCVKWSSAPPHLTLIFLGDVEEQKLPVLYSTMDQIASNFSPFDAVIGGAGAFPNAHRPSVIWIGFEDAGESKRLHTMLHETLTASGISLKKENFVPHITVARVSCRPDERTLSSFMEIHGQKNLGMINVREIVLKKSELTPKGALHTTVHKSSFQDR